MNDSSARVTYPFTSPRPRGADGGAAGHGVLDTARASAGRSIHDLPTSDRFSLGSGVGRWSGAAAVVCFAPFARECVATAERTLSRDARGTRIHSPSAHRSSRASKRRARERGARRALRSRPDSARSGAARARGAPATERRRGPGLDRDRAQERGEAARQRGRRSAAPNPLASPALASSSRARAWFS